MMKVLPRLSQEPRDLEMCAEYPGYMSYRQIGYNQVMPESVKKLKAAKAGASYEGNNFVMWKFELLASAFD